MDHSRQVSRQIAIIAPEQLINAFSVVINSVPNQSLLASAASLDRLVQIVGPDKPDVVLIYMVREEIPENGNSSYEVISSIKKIWPDSVCVTIVRYPSQINQAKEIGADLALVDGVNAEKLLAAIKV